jgi:lipopolysaccharide/colanic/teichoic acid biosynthesis glycosyltransferase
MNLNTLILQDTVKTICDYFIAFISLVALIPVILILAILIKITGKGPVVYSQERIGRDGRPFIIYKFRSMHNKNCEGIPLISDKSDIRITALGRFMRKHKFDEIPNFINVLKGEMSIIGPRPEQKFYIDQIMQKDPRYKRLQMIKPGITSWGQIKFGYASDVDEMITRMEYDLFYLDNRSLLFDLKIALYTLIEIGKGQGI